MSLAVATATTTPRHTAPTRPGRRRTRAVPGGPAQATRLPLRPQGCFASLRDGLRPALTPETSAAAAGSGNAGRPEPAPWRRRPAGNSRRRAAFPGITTGGPGCYAPDSPEETPHNGTNRDLRLADEVQKLDRPFHMSIQP